MQTREASAFLCSAAMLVSLGCQTTQHFHTNGWASKASTSADQTPVPGKTTYSSANEESGNAGSATAPTDAQAPADAESVVPESGGHAEPPNRRFRIPEELPGANAAPLALPPLDPAQPAETRRSLAESLFPELQPVAAEELAQSEGAPLTLAELQQMAIASSPVIRQSAALVEQARGRAVQAGLKPNPTLGYEGDTIGTADTAGYNGLLFSQEFVTANKLGLAQSAAMQGVRAAQADLRKARITLASDVRRNYFRVLIAQEQLRFTRAISKLSDEVYQAQIDLVAGGESAPYEPLQLRVFAVQARNNVTQATNSLNAAWRQLAAAMGTPLMQRRSVQGSVDIPSPLLDYETAVAMVQKHSDLVAANAGIARATTNLRLQEAIARPNVTLYAAFQHDDTTPLSNYSTNVQLTTPVPVFNRNQGNITSAHAELIKARQDYADTTNRLMSQLAETFNRYETSRVISESYRKDLVPDQVRVYRGVYDRFLIDGQSVDFAQVVISQQTLGQVVSSYVASLQSEWLATVDLAETLQVDDLMTMDGSANSEWTTTSSVSPEGLPLSAVTAQDATGAAKIVAPYEQTIP